MPIKTSIPSNRRRPGNSQEFNYKSASRGLSPLNYNVALIGCKLATGTATVEKPYPLFSEKDGDDYFGAGSEAAIMARAFFAMARAINLQPFIWGVGVAEPGAGTQATKTITITGPATAGGDLEIRIAGRTIRAPVVNGDSANTIAAALKSAVDAYQAVEPLIVTASVATNVVTLTARHKGVNGNDTPVESVSAPLGVTATVATGVTATGSYTLTNAFDSLASGRTYHAVALANHIAADVTAAKVHLGAVGDPATKRWSTIFLAEFGTVATVTTLATGSNDFGVQILAYEQGKNLPGEAAAMAALANFAISDPAANFDGFELPLYPVDAPLAFTPAEIETLLAAGVTPLVPSSTNDGTRIVRSVTTKTTEGGVPFEALLDLSNVKVMYYVATQMDIRLTRDFQGLDAKMVPDIGARVEDAAYDVLKEVEKLEIVKGVDEHKKEIRFEVDLVVPTRGNLAYPIAPILNLHQLAGVGNLLVGA